MPQVSVKDSAHIDARLRLAGQLLNLNHECLGWRLIQVWAQVTARSSTIISAKLVSVAIGKKGADVAQALIDAQLATPAGEDLDLAPMQTMFGDCNWQQTADNEIASADSQTYERTTDVTFVSSTRDRPLRDRVIDKLSMRSYTRKELRVALSCRYTNMLDAVRDLVADGVVVDEGGRLSLADSVEESEPGTNAELGTDVECQTASQFLRFASAFGDMPSHER